MALGAFNVIAVMAVSEGVVDIEGSSVINIILQASSFAASLVFTFFYRKLGVDKMLIIATLGVVITLPLVLSFGYVAFLIILLVCVFFRFIIDSAIPTALVLIIPEKQMGAYSSIRMLVFTLGQAISSALVLPLSSVLGYFGVLVLASLMQLICGVGHYMVIASHKKSRRI
jgi:MFS family permease